MSKKNPEEESLYIFSHSCEKISSYFYCYNFVVPLKSGMQNSDTQNISFPFSLFVSILRYVSFIGNIYRNKEVTEDHGRKGMKMVKSYLGQMVEWRERERKMLFEGTGQHERGRSKWRSKGHKGLKTTTAKSPLNIYIHIYKSLNGAYLQWG